MFGAFAFDIKNFICACRVRRCGGTEIKTLLKPKVLRENRPLPRNSVKLFTVFVKLAALCGISDTRKSVCQSVFRSRDPLRNESKLMLDSLCCDSAGHPQASILSGAAIPKEEKRSFVVRVNCHFVTVPSRTPEVDGDHVGQKFEVGNPEFFEVFGCGGGEVLVVGVVVSAQAGFTLVPSVRGSVQRDANGGFGDQKGDSVS